MRLLIFRMLQTEHDRLRRCNLTGEAGVRVDYAARRDFAAYWVLWRAGKGEEKFANMTLLNGQIG